MLALIYDTRAKRLGPLLRGHLLWYERREGPGYTAWAGLCLLLVFVLFEFLIGPRMEGVAALGLERPAAGLRTLILLAAFLAAVKLVGVKWVDVGFVPLNRWRAAEWAYLAQVLIAASVVFFVLFGGRLGLAQATPAAWMTIGAFVLTQLVWGIYQEAMYRGVLQTELSRRFGVWGGALLANMAFAFGPLHFYHLADMSNLAATATMMGSIFLIGLVFAFIFARARNVWLVGLLHGVGDVFGGAGHLLQAAG